MLDLLVITDFAMKGGSFVSTLNTIEAAVAAEMTVGVFHWRRYDLDTTKPIDPGSAGSPRTAGSSWSRRARRSGPERLSSAIR